jgi:glycerol uptake facilitator-like aquaporin
MTAQGSGAGAESAASAVSDKQARHDAALERRYLIRFEEDTLRSRPLRIRLIIEFVGTFLLVVVVVGAGVIDRYAGGHPVTRAAAAIAAGALIMALIYAWGPLSGLHINPLVTIAFYGRGVFPLRWVAPYCAAQFAGGIGGALFLQAIFSHVSAGSTYPIGTPGGTWRAFVMEIVLTAILVSVILHTATGHRSIGHNAAIAVGSTVALLVLFASPVSGSSMNWVRTLAPDIVGNNFTGWWAYVFGDLIGAVIAVALIALVRGMPNKAERAVAQGDGVEL